VAKSIKQIIRKRSKYTNIRTTTNSVQIYKKINKSLKINTDKSTRYFLDVTALNISRKLIKGFL